VTQGSSVHCTLQQEISNAADDAARRYMEITPVEEKSHQGVANAMRVGVKEKIAKLVVKMGKLLAVANPVHGPAFLEKV